MPLQHYVPYHSALKGKGVLVCSRSLVHFYSNYTMKGHEYYTYTLLMKMGRLGNYDLFILAAKCKYFHLRICDRI